MPGKIGTQHAASEDDGVKWFLAELFVSPGNQGRGIGSELLKRTLQHAEKTRATNKALITFTFNGVIIGGLTIALLVTGFFVWNSRQSAFLSRYKMD